MISETPSPKRFFDGQSSLGQPARGDNLLEAALLVPETTSAGTRVVAPMFLGDIVCDSDWLQAEREFRLLHLCGESTLASLLAYRK
jgi:hypothetical protein